MRQKAHVTPPTFVVAKFNKTPPLLLGVELCRAEAVYDLLRAPRTSKPPRFDDDEAAAAWLESPGAAAAYAALDERERAAHGGLATSPAVLIGDLLRARDANADAARVGPPRRKKRRA